MASVRICEARDCLEDAKNNRRIRYCEARDCLNTNRNCDLSFFSFPLKNPNKLKKWLDSIDMKESNRKCKCLCSNHFKMRCFTNYFRTRLLPEAVPTIQTFDEREIMDVAKVSRAVEIARLIVKEETAHDLVSVKEETTDDPLPVKENTVDLPFSAKKEIDDDSLHVTEKTADIPISVNDKITDDLLNVKVEIDDNALNVKEETVSDPLNLEKGIIDDPLLVDQSLLHNYLIHVYGLAEG